MSLCFENEIFAYIQKDYNVIWSHSKSSFQDWNIFLIGELHEENVQKINGLFVSKFGRPGDLLLVEGCPVLKIEKRPEEATNRFFVDSTAITDENIRGWDTQLDLNLARAYGFLTSQGCSQLFYGKAIWPNPGPIRKLIEKSATGTEPEYIDKYVAPFLKEKILPLSEQADRLEEHRRELDFDFSETESEDPLLEEQIEDLQTQIEKLRMQAVQEVKDVLIRLENQQDELMRETFSDRTKNMIFTLQEVHKYVCEGNKVYLLAGCWHLRQHPTETDLRFSLAPLYDFLQDKKHIVILEPKIIKEITKC